MFSLLEHVVLDNVVIFSLSAHTFNSSKCAYIVVSLVIGVSKSNLVVYVSSVYQSSNVYPVFVVSVVGLVTLLPYVIVWEATVDPPSVSNETV